MNIAPLFFALTAVAFVGPVVAAPFETRIPEAALTTAAQLREQALASDLGYNIVESLTTEVGPRMAGSEADARAVAWAQTKFKELGYDKVWLEPVTSPKWVRRSERGEVLGAHSQALTLTALGGSPGGTVEAEVVRFVDLPALEAAAVGSLAGKIAFVDFRMQRKRDDSDYSEYGWKIRQKGPSIAIRKGAIGYLMRSAGTDSHRNPHTGNAPFDEDLKPVPSAALAWPDADQLSRLLARGPQRVRVALDCGWDGGATSYNVIGEIRGSSQPNEFVLLGAHLDSWDLGTGAVDDGAGIGVTMATGALIGKLPKPPARTIRVVAYANEERGLWGGKAYAAEHAKDVRLHQFVAESDEGAGRVYAFNTNAPDYAKSAVKQIADALAPLGIEAATQGEPGPDIGPFAEHGVAWAALRQDATNYFDYHHTPDDTLDKIDAKDLAQNVAAYVVFAYLAASAQGDFGSSPSRVPPAPH